MTATPSGQPLLAVGRDCDCGHPLVWHADQQVCAVYGTHPARTDIVRFRDRTAPGNALVQMMTAHTWSNVTRRRNVRVAS